MTERVTVKQSEEGKIRAEAKQGRGEEELDTGEQVQWTGGVVGGGAGCRGDDRQGWTAK